MNETKSTPVVILAFANDQDRYLQMIVKERKSIAKALQEHDDRSYIKVVKEENTSIKDVFELCTRYADRVAIFHYGGHADGTQLQLEAATGTSEMADASGLAQLLGQQQSLQLVFLNGCATLDQVKTLFASGVKAVIATAVPINDTVATEFAEQFYQALANRATVKRAFDTAKAFVTTRYGKTKEVSEFRAVNWEDKKNTETSGVPWGLYVNATGEDALAWRLPEVAEHQVIIRGAASPGKTGAPVNTELTKRLLEKMAQLGRNVPRAADDEDGAVDERIIRGYLLDSFPAPVGEQVRKLFTMDSIDVDRLRQLIVTYETVVQLSCYALLSQLWNARRDNSSLALSDEQWGVFNGFLALTAENQATFDYIALMTAILDAFHANTIVPFVEEFAGLGDVLRQDDFVTAHRFMEQLRAELRHGKVGAEEIDHIGAQAERHLSAIMVAFAFLVKYKLSTIKRIDIIKMRHKAPVYRHRLLMLDKVSLDPMDTERDYASFTDSESVVLLKRAKDLKDYLSLSPFVIDENAFTGQPKSKLFFYSHHDSSDDSYHFRFVNDADQSLAVPSEDKKDGGLGAALETVKNQFDDFRETMSRV